MDYTDEQLEEIYLQYLRENRRQSYREMRRAGDLERHVAAMVRHCRNAKEHSLSEGAADDEIAWNWAIRTALLDSRPD